MLRPERGDNFFLRAFHSLAFVGFGIFVPGQVEEAMDKVAEDLAGERFTVFLGLAKRDFGADDDFTVMKCDHIGWSFDLHEIAMNLIACGIIDECYFESGKVGEGRIIFCGVFQCQLRGLVCDVLKRGEPVLRNFGSLLVVSDDYLECHENESRVRDVLWRRGSGTVREMRALSRSGSARLAAAEGVSSAFG